MTAEALLAVWWDVDAVLPPLQGTGSLSGRDTPVPAGLCARGPASQLRNPFQGILGASEDLWNGRGRPAAL